MNSKALTSVYTDTVTRVSVAGWIHSANPARDAANGGALGDRNNCEAFGYFTLNSLAWGS